MSQKIVIFIYSGVRITNPAKKKNSVIISLEGIAFRKFDYALGKLEFREKVI
jgi:hypothetical protein